MPPHTPERVRRDRFWSYLRTKEIDFLPSGALRWWLLGLIVLGWAVEQYEGLKTGPVLVYILKDFDKTLTEWGYVAACAGFVYSGGAVLLVARGRSLRPPAVARLSGIRLRGDLGRGRDGTELHHARLSRHGRQLRGGGHEPGGARRFARSNASNGARHGVLVGVARVHDRRIDVDRRRRSHAADLARLAVAILDRGGAGRGHGAGPVRVLSRSERASAWQRRAHARRRRNESGGRGELLSAKAARSTAVRGCGCCRSPSCSGRSRTSPCRATSLHTSHSTITSTRRAPPASRRTSGSCSRAACSCRVGCRIDCACARRSPHSAASPPVRVS